MVLKVLVLLVGVLGSVFGESHGIVVLGFVVLELCIQIVFGDQLISMSPHGGAGCRQVCRGTHLRIPNVLAVVVMVWGSEEG